MHAATKQEGGTEGGPHQDDEVCPVCQEPLGQELAMMPCGHQLCVRCHMALVDRSAPGPKVSSRAHAELADVEAQKCKAGCQTVIPVSYVPLH